VPVPPARAGGKWDAPGFACVLFLVSLQRVTRRWHAFAVGEGGWREHVTLRAAHVPVPADMAARVRSKVKHPPPSLRPSTPRACVTVPHRPLPLRGRVCTVRRAGTAGVPRVRAPDAHVLALAGHGPGDAGAGRLLRARACGAAAGTPAGQTRGGVPH
jgi:hypothetical protein